MSQTQPLPSDAERQAFVEKLDRFRTGLPASEQRMLDAMFLAAFTPQRPDEVQGYEGVRWVPERTDPYAWWYRGSGGAAWNNTPWEIVYIGIGTPPTYPGQPLR